MLVKTLLKGFSLHLDWEVQMVKTLNHSCRVKQLKSEKIAENLENWHCEKTTRAEKAGTQNEVDTVENQK